MSRNSDYNRNGARARSSARRGGSEAPRERASRSDYPNSPRPIRGSKSASLSDLHQVSPQMRERYGMNEPYQAGRRVDRYSDEWDSFDGRSDGRRGRQAEDWRSPSLDPIGGRSLNGGRSGNSGGLGGLPVSPAILIGLLVVIVLLVAVIVLAMNRCSEGSADVSTAGTQTEQTSASTDSTATGSEASGSGSASSSGTSSGSSSTPAATTSAVDDIDRDALVKVVDEDVADKLINRAKTSEDARWIAQNPDKFAMDGPEVQQKLLKLAADEPAAQSYVRNFPEKYPAKTPSNGQVKTVSTGKGVPRFYQWDELWGYTVYSGTAFGLTGCCPTCLAMVYQSVTGNTDMSPYDMGELAVRDGYATEYEGTYATFLVDEAHTLGLPVSEIDVTKKALKNALQSGQVVIVNFAPGYFTAYGHYVVITGITQDGSVVMNDPYSEERSNQTWDIDTIVEESQGFYAYG